MAMRMEGLAPDRPFIPQNSTPSGFFWAFLGDKNRDKTTLFPRQEWLNPWHFWMSRENREMDFELPVPPRATAL